MASNFISNAQTQAARAEAWNFFEDPKQPGTVKIVCGYERIIFYARKRSICQGSVYFNIACTHGFRETGTGILELHPDTVDPATLHNILKYLHGIGPSNTGGWVWPTTHHAVMKLYQKARYFVVNGMTDEILQTIRAAVTGAEIHLNCYWRRSNNAALYEKTWKQILIGAQVAFSLVPREDMSDDCEAIREIYMKFLHKNHGILMSLGMPFMNFMRSSPDLCFFMMKDAYENKDRHILSPQGFLSICAFCGNPVGGYQSFFILVSTKDDEVKHICRKVACRRLVKKGDF